MQIHLSQNDFLLLTGINEPHEYFFENNSQFRMGIWLQTKKKSVGNIMDFF